MVWEVFLTTSCLEENGNEPTKPKDVPKPNVNERTSTSAYSWKANAGAPTRPKDVPKPKDAHPNPDTP